MNSFRDITTLSTGLLLGRLILGTLLAAHGSQKLLGWFGGYGIAGTGGYFESIGFRPGKFFAAAAGLTEIVGGTLLALGLLGPIGPALIITIMIVAAVSVHLKHGVFAMNNGIEVPLLYATGALTLALTGPGLFSIDAALGLDQIWTPELVWGAIALGVVAGLVNLSLRRTAPQVSQTA
jgi:putative oxidoreductase